MAESASHKRAKSKAAGKSGQTEVQQKGGTRLDAASKRRATEVERSGNPRSLEAAARRLKKSGKPQRVLQVPQKDMDKAAEAMRRAGVSGSVKNMSSTRRKSVRKK